MPIDPSVTRRGPNDPPLDTQTGAGDPPLTGKKAPGNAFIDVLLGSDLDGHGITREEIQTAIGKLDRLAHDGLGNDAAEKLLLAEIRKARASRKPIALEYEVKDGNIVFRFAGADRPGPVVDVLHTPDRPAAGDIVDIGGVRVGHGDDPGDFYCEHIFFSAQLAASQPGSSVLSNPQGEKLVGFLHVPSDPWTGAQQDSDPAIRHASTRKVVGAGLRGYFDEILKTKPKSTPHVLLTGYDQFGWVVNNPTGDFVTQQDNLDAAMRHAFGDLLVSAKGVEIGQGDREGPRTFEYMVRNPATQKPRKIRISTVRFPVDDRTIDPDGERSIQSLIGKLKPHGVISMGVAGQGAYRAEHRADANSLVRTATEYRHDDAAGEGVRLADNYALARAIKLGTSAFG